MRSFFVLIECVVSGDKASFIVQDIDPASAFIQATNEKNRRVEAAGVAAFRKYVIVQFQEVGK